MPITQSLNSKGNVKKSTSQDLPFASQQPVMSRYSATSTAGQTVINLSFSVDQALADQFFLIVDGKTLRPGSGNDFVFSSIGSDNRSSQITLAQALPVNMNIQAFMLGMKRESEFGMDNRFVQMYEAQEQGFQGFVKSSTLMNATTTTGTPVPGTFYSTISNRAAITDLSQNLRANFGIDRVPVQQIIEVPSEYGPAGERVFTPVNDVSGQLRFVGAGWQSYIDANGQFVGSNTTGDYIEVTFYGTGLNLLAFTSSTVRDHRASVDGAAEGANFNPTGSNVLTGRNYSMNVPLNVVSGLSLGVHTVKIRNVSGGLFLFGFEILNISTSVVVNPGTSFVQGKKYTSASQYTFAPTSMATGTRGGRTVVYQNGDGSIGSAFQAVDPTALTFASTNHANEELSRVHHFREFGISRSDDFSLVGGAVGVSLAFTLEDGTTTLSGTGLGAQNEAANLNQNGSVLVFTFVGTGLDIVQKDSGNGGTDNYNVSIDGASAVSLPSAGNTTARVVKIVSGLPYGTHTVKFTRVSASTWALGVQKFLVYQPKKPTVPSGVLELADYNIMANYSGSAVLGGAQAPVGTGVLTKYSSRELTYVGTWLYSLNPGNNTLNGQYMYSTTNGDYMEYTFFGTGVELVANVGSTNQTVTIQIDGTNYTGAATNIGTGSWNAGTSTWNPYSSVGGTLQITGLPLGLHKVRATNLSVPSGIYWTAVNVITPVHSTKSNGSYGIQNTLPVGSQSISDSRKFTSVKESSIQKKKTSQAFGMTSSPTTSSTALVPMPDMSVTHTNTSGEIKITYVAAVSNSTTPADVYLQIVVDGSFVGTSKWSRPSTAGYNVTTTDTLVLQVAPGTHKIDVYWSVNAGTATANGTNRNLLVEEK